MGSDFGNGSDRGRVDGEMESSTVGGQNVRTGSEIGEASMAKEGGAGWKSVRGFGAVLKLVRMFKQPTADAQAANGASESLSQGNADSSEVSFKPDVSSIFMAGPNTLT